MDLKYALRTLARARGFTFVVVATLALCVGANSAMFSVVDHILLRPLPYPQPEQLAQLVTLVEGRQSMGTGQTGAMWEALRGNVPSLDIAAATGGFGETGVNLTVGDRAEYVIEARVSAGYFRVLGVVPQIGRELNEDEDRAGGPEAAVISDALWRHAFNASPDVIGQTVMLRGEAYRVVGVMPATFVAQTVSDETAIEPALWTPARACRTCEGGGQNYEFIARVKPGHSWAEADAEVARVGDDVLRPRNLPGVPRASEHIVPLHAAATSDVRVPILILWGAVGVVLLIGCVNVAGLLVARASARAPEIALRMAIGGSRAAVIRQLMMESVVLAVAGGALGLLIATFLSSASAPLLQHAFRVSGDFGIDWRVFIVTAVAALATSVAFGLLPAADATRVDIRRVLVEAASPTIAGRARRRPRQVLVVTQVALSVVLLVAAGLLFRTLNHLTHLRAGFDGTHAISATLSLEDARYATVPAVNHLADHTIEQIHAIPTVEHAAVALTLPYERALNVGARWTGGDAIPIMNLTYVTPEYFDALRIPIVRGRAISRVDAAGAAGAIVVNEAFVRRSSADRDPIGRSIQIMGGPRTIVGIAGDIQQKNGGIIGFEPVAPIPAAYVPLAQTTDAFLKMVHAWFSPSWIVRTSVDDQNIASEMQRAIANVDPTLPFAKFRTFDVVEQQAVAPQRAQSILLGVFAALALLLAAIGLYGIVAGSVIERTHEFGVRLALGATPRRAAIELAAPGMILAGAGVLLGLVLARAASSVLSHLVWGISPTDSLTFFVAVAAVLAVAGLASLIPSRRVSRLDPSLALRDPRN